MGQILFDLERALRSKQGSLKPEEEKIFRACKAEALNSFTVGSLAAGFLTFPATRRLATLSRISLSGGAAAFVGLWQFGRYLDRCVERVLALDGHRMQLELANIILKNYRDDPWRMQLLSKHFYSEEVFDDTTPDRSKLKWRYRSFYSDGVHVRNTHESDSPSYSKSDSPSDYHADYDKYSPTKFKQVPTNHAADVLADPFDCVFGNLATREEIHLPSTSSMPPGTHTRAHKRSHRRRRMRHQDSTSNYQNV